MDWVKEKGRNFLVFIAGALNIATEEELEADGIVDPAVLRDGSGEPYGYCAANYSYWEEIYYKYTYVYVYTSNVTVLDNLLSCTEQDTSNGGTKQGTKTTCESYLVYPDGGSGKTRAIMGGGIADNYWGDELMFCYFDEGGRKVCVPERA